MAKREELIAHQQHLDLEEIGLVGLKLLAVNITLGSGFSGGIFAPALFLGGMLGGAFGGFINDDHLRFLALPLAQVPGDPLHHLALLVVLGGRAGGALYDLSLDNEIDTGLTWMVAPAD